MYHALHIPELGKLEMVEVYNYYDIPILFSCKNAVSQLYIVFFADRLPDHDVWLYAEVSIARLNLIRAGKIDLFDTFSKPEMGRLLKVIIPSNNSVEFSSKFILPSELSEDIFPPVNDYLDIEYMPYVPETSIVDIIEVLKAIQGEQEAPYTVTGDLMGLSLPTRKFEIHTSEDKIIKGSIEDNADSSITSATISSRYDAEIRTVVKRNETTNEVVKIEHVLLNLEEITQD